MEKYYSLSTIARILSSTVHGRFVTEDKVWGWVKQGKIQVVRMSDKTRGFGKYPYQVKETHLIEALVEMGYDAGLILHAVE
jgi:hypothetical protein